MTFGIFTRSADADQLLYWRLFGGESAVWTGRWVAGSELLYHWKCFGTRRYTKIYIHRTPLYHTWYLDFISLSLYVF